MKTYTSYRTFNRRGHAVIYVIVMAVALLGLVSLAVDVGHVQVVKSQLLVAAEAAARAGANNLSSGTTAAQTAAAAAAALNQADGTNVTLTTTTDVIVGTWSNGSFSVGGASPNAVKVYARRTAATSNAVRLSFGPAIGRSTCDVTVTSVAAVTTTTVNVNVSSTSDLFFAGMSSGTTDAFGDEMTDNGPTQVSIPVTPGTYLSFSTFTGTTSVVPGSVPYAGPAGNTIAPENSIQHGQNWDGTWPLGGSYTENGIANAVMAESTLTGLFLGSSAPNTNTAPSGVVDWTQSSQNNQAVYNSIQLQQPFAIGDGKTTGGTVQQFLVPTGATRFFISIWDGVDYNNNGGSLTGNITSKVTQIVQ